MDCNVRAIATEIKYNEYTILLLQYSVVPVCKDHGVNSFWTSDYGTLWLINLPECTYSTLYTSTSVSTYLSCKRGNIEIIQQQSMQSIGL